jgi:hypothetical protein
MLVTFNSNIKSIPHGKTLEVERIESGDIWFKGHDKPLNAKAYADKFSVSLPRNIEIADGDKILIRRNHKQGGLINGTVLTVDSIKADGSMDTRDKDGKNFHIPADYRHFTHGYVVTSYKSQGRTHDYEVIAAEKLDAKTAYVACSRARQSINVFTPDKENLFKNLGTPADRTAAYDVIGNIRADLWRNDESDAFQQAVKDNLIFQRLNYANDFDCANDHTDDFTNTKDYTNNRTNDFSFERTSNNANNYANDFSL